MKLQNYIDSAKEHEFAFRLLLDYFNKEHINLSVEEIYKKYSDGNRYGKWSIMNFIEIQPNIFEFTHKDMAALSGYETTDLWKVERGQLKYLKNIYWIRS